MAGAFSQSDTDHQPPINMAESHKHSLEAEWEKGALWARPWQHAWTRNALKQYKWMNHTLHHYRKKQESLWAMVRREGKKRRR